MNCENINNLFLDYLDNNLSPIEIVKVENHLAQCASCSTKLEQFKSLNKIFVKTNRVQTTQFFQNEFASILETEKTKISKFRIRLSSVKNSLKIAASILIFVAGSVFGIIIQKHNLNTSKIVKLEYELNNLKQQVIFETLKDQTASEKIMAINYANEKQKLEISFANLLINILNTDENISVRMAALDALSNFTDDTFIHDNLLNSLNMQDDPRLQIGLINLISTIDDDESQKAIIEFLNQDEIDPEVKLFASELALINL